MKKGKKQIGSVPSKFAILNSPHWAAKLEEERQQLIQAQQYTIGTASPLYGRPFLEAYLSGAIYYLPKLSGFAHLAQLLAQQPVKQ